MNRIPARPVFQPKYEWWYKSITPGSCTTRNSQSVRGRNADRWRSNLVLPPSDKSGAPCRRQFPHPGCRAEKNSPCRHGQSARRNPPPIHRRPGNDSDARAIVVASNARQSWEVFLRLVFSRMFRQRGGGNFAGGFDPPELAGQFASMLRGHGFHRQTARMRKHLARGVKDFPSGKIAAANQHV